MDADKFKLFEEDMRQLYLFRMDYNNAKKEANKNSIFKDIKNKVQKMFTDYNLSKYDASFMTSSSMYDIEHMFHDLKSISDVIKNELK